MSHKTGPVLLVSDEQRLMLAAFQWYHVNSISMVLGEHHLIGGLGEQHFKPSGDQCFIGRQGEQHLTFFISAIA